MRTVTPAEVKLTPVGESVLYQNEFGQYVGHDDGQLKWYTITRMTIKVGKPMQEVVCDGCNKDFTESMESGGIQFETKAFGPCCQESVERSAEKYKETHFIKARCPEGKSFADWVREDLR